MLPVASLMAVALYLIPVGVVLAARRRPEAAVASIAILVPAAVAADLLVILLLARVVRLDAAVVASRVLWLAAAAGVALRQRRRRAPPDARADRRETAALAAAAALAVLLSASLSRRFAIWDRQWHIPLVDSLRGQSVPFVNVYQPHLRLGYHIAGDVLGATLQVLSGARLHASLALSLAHDLVFALLGVTLAASLLARRPGRGAGWLVFAAVAPLAVLLAGPPVMSDLFTGYSYMNYFQMSYRPHAALAGLFITGLLAAVLPPLPPAPRLADAAAPTAGATPAGIIAARAILIAALAISDEPSAGLAAPALALLLLACPDPGTAPRSRALRAASLPAAAIAALLIFPSTVGGSTHLPTTWSRPNVPSFFGPALPLPSLRGLGTLLADLAPMLALVAVLAVVAARARRRDLAAVTILGGGVLLASTALLTCLVVAQIPAESHRFMTLPEVVIPTLALLAFGATTAPLRVALALPLAASMGASLAWAIHNQPLLQEQFRPERYAPGLHQVDCRAATGARLFERATPTYAPPGTWHLWAGCHPVLAPGTLEDGGDVVDVHWPLFGKSALAALDRTFAGAADDVVAACPASAADDPVCRYARARDRCAPAGTGWQRCRVTAADRAALLAAPWP
jgi:hypothetical protein